ncbi:hypothetical protein [Kineococcus rubinsiae]|uniref:hypothetical protein n=1 Tax=Kineococcus rubinsiae TaxID=2609562 RepID=UPI00143120A7|nr:hypothetical protein [Kineococcus rubinsiae]NIZ90396.1 hypothetical protein [Kineococcus rubinsiae]
MSTTDVTIYTAGFALLLVQRLVMSNRSHWWLGAVLPMGWLIAGFVFLVERGTMDEWRGWAATILGAVVLLGIWAEGHESRKKRLQSEDARIDALNAHQAVDH